MSTPVFSIPPGYFTETSLITCSDQQNTIHYTLDGTRPDNNSQFTLYQLRLLKLQY